MARSVPEPRSDLVRFETDDGVTLAVKVAGSGTPVLFLHEFAGDARSFDAEVVRFASRYRCITPWARGYPPSDVPDQPDAYSLPRAVGDAVAVLDHLGIAKAHLVGLSMGGFAALHLAMDHPRRVRSVFAGGVGYGADPSTRAAFALECERVAAAYLTDGSASVASWYARGPARVQLLRKRPEAWRRFAESLAGHDARGAALTMLGVQRLRPSLLEHRAELARIEVPVMVVAGDQDDGCPDVALALGRAMPTAGVAIWEQTGHTLNLEEPERFASVLERFWEAADAGTWPCHDVGTSPGTTMGAPEEPSHPTLHPAP